jgi:hypothetical protein
MELTERDLAWFVLIVLLAYPILSMGAIMQAMFDSSVPSLSLRFENAMRRFVFGLIGFFFFLFIIQILNDYSEYHIIPLLPQLYQEVFGG